MRCLYVLGVYSDRCLGVIYNKDERIQFLQNFLLYLEHQFSIGSKVFALSFYFLQVGPESFEQMNSGGGNGFENAGGFGGFGSFRGFSGFGGFDEVSLQC